MTLDIDRAAQHPHGRAVGIIQEAFREAGRELEWLNHGHEIHVYVEYRAQTNEYDITAFWIEDWKPGNYGYRMRGDKRIKAEEFPYSRHTKKNLLNEIREEALDYHWEIGYYPCNEERRRAFWDSSETFSYKDGTETRHPPKNPNAMKEYNERNPHDRTRR